MSDFYQDNRDLETTRNTVVPGAQATAITIEKVSQNYTDPGDAGKITGKLLSKAVVALDVALTYDHYKSKGVSTGGAIALTVIQKAGAGLATLAASETGPGAIVAGVTADVAIEHYGDTPLNFP